MDIEAAKNIAFISLFKRYFDDDADFSKEEEEAVKYIGQNKLLQEDVLLKLIVSKEEFSYYYCHEYARLNEEISCLSIDTIKNISQQLFYQKKYEKFFSLILFSNLNIFETYEIISKPDVLKRLKSHLKNINRDSSYYSLELVIEKLQKERNKVSLNIIEFFLKLYNFFCNEYEDLMEQCLECCNQTDIPYLIPYLKNLDPYLMEIAEERLREAN